VFSIELPPLRKCKDDLFFLAQEFLAKTCEEYGLEDKIFSSEALSKLLSYDWPGNIRELSNVIERAAIFCDDSIIYSEHINLPIKSGKMTLKEITKELEKSIIIETLRSLGNDKKQTMEELGLSKSAFYAKLKEYEIDL
jgi:DNA-binding NtrC family response regulator